MQAIITTNATPIYLKPTRNDYGIIGPIKLEELNTEAVKRKIEASPIIKDKSKTIKISVITNSTYDGICYNAGLVKERLKSNDTAVTENLHFDEAWYAYARFNPMYEQHYATYYEQKDPAYNLIFATHSTHKLLAAFSQASMVHILDQRGKFSPGRFNESFMMHASTSPQYGIIASLDVATKMMDGNFGKTLTQESIVEANVFRKKMAKTSQELSQDWWFNVWQPEGFADTPNTILNEEQRFWELKPVQQWHGFEGIDYGYVMLDPIKVTVLTPGVNNDDQIKIPASLVSKYLRQQGVVAEKTGFYSFLILFSIGVTRGKSGTLLAELFKFKQLYDANEQVSVIFPDLAPYYGNRRIKDLCNEMHQNLEDHDYKGLSRRVYDNFPEQVYIPNYAYQQVVNGHVELVPLDELNSRVAAVMVAPYPPGIPVIMPGERFNEDLQKYLQMYQQFDSKYPGFETEIHGIEMETDASGQKLYKVYCVKG
jgi:lysine decarboxylase/arginine decarboxylase